MTLTNEMVRGMSTAEKFSAIDLIWSTMPYSKIELSAFTEASAKAGLPVNPSFGCQGAYIELVKPLMLTLPRPVPDAACVVLFQGINLTVRTSSPADLVARLPERFREDVVVRENLENLAADILVWRGANHDGA